MLATLLLMQLSSKVPGKAADDPKGGGLSSCFRPSSDLVAAAISKVN